MAIGKAEQKCRLTSSSNRTLRVLGPIYPAAVLLPQNATRVNGPFSWGVIWQRGIGNGHPSSVVREDVFAQWKMLRLETSRGRHRCVATREQGRFQFSNSWSGFGVDSFDGGALR